MQSVDVKNELKRSYLDYALSVIVESALERARRTRGRSRRWSGSEHLSLSRHLTDEIVEVISAELPLTPEEEKWIRATLRRIRLVMPVVTHQTNGGFESIKRLLRSGGRGLRSPPSVKLKVLA